MRGRRSSLLRPSSTSGLTSVVCAVKKNSQFSQSSDDLLALGVALLGLLLRLRLLGLRLSRHFLSDHLTLDSAEEFVVKVSRENESLDLDRIVFGLLAGLRFFFMLRFRLICLFRDMRGAPRPCGNGARGASPFSDPCSGLVCASTLPCLSRTSHRSG